jgi:hypothetical protein
MENSPASLPGPDPQKADWARESPHAEFPVNKPEPGPNQKLADNRCAGPWIVCG